MHTYLSFYVKDLSFCTVESRYIAHMDSMDVDSTPSQLIAIALTLCPDLTSLDVDVDEASIAVVRRWVEQGHGSGLGRLSALSDGLMADLCAIIQHLQCSLHHLKIDCRVHHLPHPLVPTTLPDLQLRTLEVAYHTSATSLRILDFFQSASIKTLRFHSNGLLPINLAPYASVTRLTLVLD